MASKVKGFNAKQFATDHAEKFALGVVLVLVVLGLAGTSWIPYQRPPQEIVKKVGEARDKIAVATWPEEEQAAFVLTDETQPRRIVDKGINDRILVTPNFVQSQPQYKDKDSRDEPLQEPEFLPVVDLIATDARVLIAMSTGPQDLLAAGGAAAEGMVGRPGTPGTSGFDADDRPDEFRERGGGFSGATYGAAGVPAAIGGFGTFGRRESDADRDYSSRIAPELLRRGAGGRTAASSVPGRGSAAARARARPTTAAETDARERGNRRAARGRGRGLDGEYEGEGLLGASGADADYYGPTVDGKGYPFVSVRGVFEFREQITRYMDAIHKGRQDALQYFMIVDFQLERQKLISAPDTWSDWERVNDQVFRDILRQSDGFDPDVVQAVVTDSAITCPLPARLTGVYYEQATHPRLEQYKLSDEELEREMEYNGLLLEKVLEQNQLPEGQIVKKGFSDMVFDARQVRQGFFGLASPYALEMQMEDRGMPGVGRGAGRAAQGRVTGRQAQLLSQTLDQLAAELAEKTLEADSPEAKEKLKEWIMARAGAEGDLLLFRYFDFDVEPGATYRYRVRIELQNPNFGQPLAAAGGIESVVVGETRWTPWSAPTAPVRVEETVKYFLTTVEDPRVRMNVFQYDQDVGTIVQKELQVAYGQNIGGKAKVEQPDPAKATVEEVDYTFKSEDILVDAVPDLRFSRSDHPDLQLPSDSRGLTRMTEFAAVVKPDGRLETIDPVSQADALARAKKYKTYQDEQFAYLKSGTGAAGDLGGDYAGYYDDLYGRGKESGADEMRRASRGRNLLRRGSPESIPGSFGGDDPRGGGRSRRGPRGRG